jgi:hypothetical protein
MPDAPLAFSQRALSPAFSLSLSLKSPSLTCQAYFISKRSGVMRASTSPSPIHVLASRSSMSSHRVRRDATLARRAYSTEARASFLATLASRAVACLAASAARAVSLEAVLTASARILAATRPARCCAAAASSRRVRSTHCPRKVRRRSARVLLYETRSRSKSPSVDGTARRAPAPGAGVMRPIASASAFATAAGTPMAPGPLS